YKKPVSCSPFTDHNGRSLMSNRFMIVVLSCVLAAGCAQPDIKGTRRQVPSRHRNSHDNDRRMKRYFRKLSYTTDDWTACKDGRVSDSRDPWQGRTGRMVRRGEQHRFDLERSGLLQRKP